MTESAATTFELTETYLHLDNEGGAARIEVTPAFWDSLQSGEASYDGRLVMAGEISQDMGHWEMHPAGEELLFCHSGAFEVRVDGRVAFLDTSSDFRRGDTRHVQVNAAAQGNTFFGPMAFWDETGAANNDFLGPLLFEDLVPTGDTADEDWTPSSGSDSFAMLDDAIPGGPNDTDFLHSNNPGDVTLLDYGALTVDAAAIRAVQTVTRLRDDSGALTKAFRHICWDGCMFPNEVMMKPDTWNDILAAMIKVRDAHGWA